jgi:cysteine desulfurase/selenocysteine lyase
MSYDVHKIRCNFPVLDQKIYDKPFIYLDTAASAQKPRQVLDIQNKLHNKFYGNIHRATHFMADKSTIEFENVRDKVQHFIGAESREQVIFTKGTTESVNLIAFSYSEKFIDEGDEIIVSEMEHHSNIVPWQLAAKRKKAKIVVLPFNEKGELIIDRLKNLISDKTKIIAVGHVSNVLGTINPVKQIIEIAHKRNIPVFVDGAQAVQHMAVNVIDLDADFYAFSAHKMYGPNGVGVLYGKRKWLEKIPPYQGGGEMISEVSFEKTTFNNIPFKFEAGTPNITSVIAFGAAIDFIKETGINEISAWEKELLDYATIKLKQIEGLKIYGKAKQKSGVLSFNINGVHHYDLGMLLDKTGIAVRTGHHCAEPVMEHFGISGMARASLGMYNTKDEIDMLVDSINRLKKMF